ncbi:MAG: hypothetical protein IT368_10045 [Candidatus Hydrogenedentes bacterium]|nr:hypothetical protein [Candidatus Hydrogenedentota bacterium]
MEKRTLICSCGQEMMVPASAIGRRGLCPSCGTEIEITEENTRSPHADRPRGSGLLGRRQIATATQVPREEASRRFATAVDLYNAERYAEALIVLDGLLADFPSNSHIESARTQCIEALHGPLEVPALTYENQPVDDTRLSIDLVKSVVLDKLLNGRSEEVQLKAAEIALQLLAQDRDVDEGNTSVNAQGRSGRPNPPAVIVLEQPRKSKPRRSSGGRKRKSS